MIKLKRTITESVKYRVCEAKQVGILYHVCTIDALADYIVPNDKLSGSGKYKNRILDNRTDVVSFTRNKNYVVSTRTTRISPLLFRIVIDGDRISENHKVIPYNDLAFNSITGKRTSFNPKELEQEEVVIGDIHPLSKFIQSVSYCVNDNLFDTTNMELRKIINDLNNIIPYLSKFPLIYDKNLVVESTPLPSFKSLLDCKNFISLYLSLCELKIDGKNLDVLLSKFDDLTNSKIYEGFISCLFPSMAKTAITYMPIFYKNGIDLDTIVSDCLLLFPDYIDLLKSCMVYFTGNEDILINKID